MFVSVTVCGALMALNACEPKLRLASDKARVGLPTEPVPLRLNLWGLPGALSAIVSVALKPLADIGCIVTERVQLAPALTAAPQVVL